MANEAAPSNRQAGAGGAGRVVGIGLVIAGVGMAAISVLGLVFSWGSTKAKSPAQAVSVAPTATVQSSVSPLPSVASSALAVSTPTADPVAVWQALLDPFAAAIASRDTSYLLNHIDPALYQVYTADQCRAALAKPAPDPTFHFDVLGVSGPAPWSYAAGGQTIAVDAVYTVDANVTASGKAARETHHFTLHSGQLGWFTHCSATGQ